MAKLKDGIYFEVVAIKNGITYPVKIIDTKDVSKILANAVMDGLGTIIGFDTPQKEG